MIAARFRHVASRTVLRWGVAGNYAFTRWKRIGCPGKKAQCRDPFKPLSCRHLSLLLPAHTSLQLPPCLLCADSQTCETRQVVVCIRATLADRSPSDSRARARKVISASY